MKMEQGGEFVSQWKSSTPQGMCHKGIWSGLSIRKDYMRESQIDSQVNCKETEGD
jgi:hypothetical protein